MVEEVISIGFIINFERRVFCAIFRRFEVPREDFISMENEKWRFFQNGSLKNFDFRQICFDLVHFMTPIGSGQ